MTDKSNFINKLITFMNKNYNYAFINNYKNDEGNFDILFDSNQYKSFQIILKDLINELNLNLISFIYSKEVDTYVLAIHKDNKLEFLSLNFYFNYIINSENILEEKTFDGKNYNIAINSNFFKEHFIKNSKLSSNGFSMSFTGPDGSGKTTILDAVEKELSKIFSEVKINHFRPTVIPRIAEVFNKAGLKKEVDEDYSNPHRGGETSKLSSFVRLFYYIFDYIYGYYKIVKPILSRNGVVIFDRYYTDIVADSKRSRINIPYKTIMALKSFVPNMKYNFLVYVDPDNILARKQELTREQILGIYERLDYILEKDKSYIKIDNNDDVNIAVSNILNHIFNEQHKKLIKKL